MLAYCMKCQRQQEIKDAEKTVTKNGVNMVKGTCQKCGTKVCRITGKS